MIIAGIDEAGYGPILGPLVVGCAAIEVPDPCSPETPCGWKLLRRIVSKKADGKRLHVNDSKKVYSPSSGLDELEKSVLTLHSTLAASADLDTFLGHVAPESLEHLHRHAWYASPVGETFPFTLQRVALNIGVNFARRELAQAGVSIQHYSAHVLPESQLNHLFDLTRNKGSASFSVVVRHIATLLDRFADRSLTIFCDRQGGRTHYGQLLMQMFPDWSLAVIRESPEWAEYELSQGPRVARIIFAEKCEEHCISVALASMLCKYLRETLMHRFNAYWRTHLPELKPTAGYWTDGLRFLGDIEPKLTELGMTREALARSR